EGECGTQSAGKRSANTAEAGVRATSGAQRLLVRQGDGLSDGLQAQRDGDEAVEAERDAGAVGQALVERGEEGFVDRPQGQAAAAALGLIRFEAAPLLRGIGQLGEAVRELDRAGEELEARGDRRLAGLEARERGLARRI